MRRHSGYRSVLVSTQATFGQTDAAWREELQLRRGVLLGGVGDQQHGVGRGQRGHRRRAVHRATARRRPGCRRAPGPPARTRPRDADLDVAPALAVARVALLADVVGELLGRHVDALDPLAGRARRIGSRTSVTDDRLGVPHDGGHRGGDVVEHRADRRADQAVDQQALALLELADHQHPDPVVEQPGPGLAQPGVEVGAVVAGDGGAGPLDDRHRFGAVMAASHGQRVGVGGGESSSASASSSRVVHRPSAGRRPGPRPVRRPRRVRVGPDGPSSGSASSSAPVRQRRRSRRRGAAPRCRTACRRSRRCRLTLVAAVDRVVVLDGDDVGVVVGVERVVGVDRGVASSESIDVVVLDRDVGAVVASTLLNESWMIVTSSSEIEVWKKNVSRSSMVTRCRRGDEAEVARARRRRGRRVRPRRSAGSCSRSRGPGRRRPGSDEPRPSSVACTAPESASCRRASRMSAAGDALQAGLRQRALRVLLELRAGRLVAASG